MNATAHPTHRAKCIELPGFQFRSHFATLLSGNVQAIRRGSKELYEIPIALTGRCVKGGREFSITSDDLEAMARNFEKRKNDQVVIDYEHASEAPEVALGGPVPAAGGIHEMALVPRPSSFAKDNGQKTKDTLTGLVQWTKEEVGLTKSR